MTTSPMNKAIAELRKYFKSEEWTQACLDSQQPIVSDNGVTGNGIVFLDTKINLALDFEGKFNEMAHEYMKYRKEQGLAHEE